MFSKLRKLISDALDDSRFVIQLADGRIRLTRGKVPPPFLSDLREFVAASGLTSGVIRGKMQDTYVRLVFSPDIPAEAHQRLRNIWHFHEPAFRTDIP
jgi:hypothetical protein